MEPDNSDQYDPDHFHRSPDQYPDRSAPQRPYVDTAEHTSYPTENPYSTHRAQPSFMIPTHYPHHSSDYSHVPPGPPPALYGNPGSAHLPPPNAAPASSFDMLPQYEYSTPMGAGPSRGLNNHHPHPPSLSSSRRSQDSSTGGTSSPQTPSSTHGGHLVHRQPLRSHSHSSAEPSEGSASGSGRRKRRQKSESDMEGVPGEVAASIKQRKEEARQQRMNAEQRRRSDLKDSYTRLQRVLPTTKDKMSKVRLVDFATQHIESLNRMHADLTRRIAELEHERDSLRRQSEEYAQRLASVQAQSQSQQSLPYPPSIPHPHPLPVSMQVPHQSASGLYTSSPTSLEGFNSAGVGGAGGGGRHGGGSGSSGDRSGGDDGNGDSHSQGSLGNGGSFGFH